MGKTEDLAPFALTAVAVVTAAVLLRNKKRRDASCCTDDDAVKARDSKAETWESHVVRHDPLQEIAPDVLYSLQAAGADRGPPCRNMHIYRVPEAASKAKHRLLIFNGIAVSEETMLEIEKLGTPSVLVVPNCYHRCCAAVWKQRYPEITVVAPECAVKQVSEVVPVDCSAQELAAQPEWSRWIHTKEIDGWGEFETVLELELESSGKGKKAVLVCDMLFTVPYSDNPGTMDRLMTWIFDSCITLPTDKDCIIVPKVARLSRIFALKDWNKSEQWFRAYAKSDGPSISALLVGHGVPVQEVNVTEGCTKALEGVADQLTKPRW